MNGLEIRRVRKGSPRSNVATDFPDFFAPILAAMTTEFWVLANTLWVYSVDDADLEVEKAFESYILEEDEHRDWFLARPGFLREFSRFLMDDWCRIFAVAPPPRSLPRYKEVLEQAFGERSRNLGQDVVGWFNCVDGAFWEIFLRDQNLLEELIQYHKKRNDTVCHRISSLDLKSWR